MCVAHFFSEKIFNICWAELKPCMQSPKWGSHTHFSEPQYTYATHETHTHKDLHTKKHTHNHKDTPTNKHRNTHPTQLAKICNHTHTKEKNTSLTHISIHTNTNARLEK